MDEINRITEQIFGAAIEVHRETGHQVGLLINFHVPRLVDGITRIVSDRSNLIEWKQPMKNSLRSLCPLCYNSS